MGQDLQHLKKAIFTLKSGVQISILLDNMVKDGPKLRVEGYEATPLIVRKEIMIKSSELAATEIISDPHIVWGDAIKEEDIGTK